MFIVKYRQVRPRLVYVGVISAVAAHYLAQSNRILNHPIPTFRAGSNLKNLKYLDIMITLNTVLSYQMTLNISN